VVTVSDGRFEIDGEPFFLYSGEIHYFRLRPAEWDVHLRAARAAGLNAVSSYIPWMWHEPEAGAVDLEGRTHPQRDLEGWLERVARYGLRFIARVGPVSNAELAHEGVPGWLLRDHPEVHVRGREITNLPHTTLLAYLEPAFLRHVERWYDAVLPRVAARAHPRGPVVMVQLCNEIGMVHWLQKAADYRPTTEARFRAFLRARYRGDVTRLAAAWGVPVASFDEVSQPPDGGDTRPRALLWDWMAFYQDYYAEYFGALHARYRAHGLELPVLANIPQFYDFDVRGRGVFAPMTTLMFREFPARVPRVVFGGAYQMRRLDHENAHDIAITTEVVRLITTPGVPSVCAELQSGIMRDRPCLYPQDVELNLKTSTAHGLNGLNAYMFSGGRNEPGMGAFGTGHEWQAPVAPDGTRRAHFAALRDFGRQVRAFGPRLARTAPLTDVAVGFYAPYWTTEYLTGPDVEAWEWKKHHLFHDGLARLLHLAHLNLRLVDLERVAPEALARERALVVFALDFMDAATQAKLRDWVRGGGRLLLNPEVPRHDLAGAPCTVLADGLGVRVTGTRHRDLLFRLGRGREELLAQGVLSALEAPDGRVLAAALDGAPCAVRVRAGRGEAVVAAFGMSHVLDWQVDLVRDLAASLGVVPAVETDGRFHVCLRRDATGGFLFVANFHDVPARGRLRLTLPGEARPTRLPARGTLAIGARRGYMLPLNVELPGGDVLRYTTAEVLDATRRAGRLTLTVTGLPGAAGEVELVTARRGAALDGRRVGTRRSGRRLRLSFTLGGGPQRLVVG
jgi:beta-galactosidase